VGELDDAAFAASVYRPDLTAKAAPLFEEIHP